jgi:hypothetical protein
MDLSASYLGFSLPHPLMPGASPLVDDLGMVRELEDAGAAAIELNVYRIAADPQKSGEQIQNRLVDMVETVTDRVMIPVAIEHLAIVRRALSHWLDEHEYASWRDAQASARALQPSDAPSSERASYLRTLHIWHV